MRKYVIALTLLCMCCLGQIFALSISFQDAHKIGEKIWKNECAGSIEGLTSWNKGENFASMGIGHFIWYPIGKEERFQETFPTLLNFLSKEGAILPEWLKVISACPWNSREEFYSHIQSPEMTSLRQFLFETRHLQAIFIANRLENILPQMVKNCSSEEKHKITTIFFRLASDANGLYALVDYLNFKGGGADSSEKYKGKGWGLLQVLEEIPSCSQKPLVDFVEAAKTVLTRRVQNAPIERQEERWLKGWFNRLDTYLE